jgi:hypothetical protein
MQANAGGSRYRLVAAPERAFAVLFLDFDPSDLRFQRVLPPPQGDHAGSPASNEGFPAALLVIGGKILSGRTKDQNMAIFQSI